MEDPVRKHIISLALVLVALSVITSGCDTDSGPIKATVKAYYDAVIAGAREAQLAQWLPDRQADAAREVDAWSRRDRQGLNLTDVHISDGPASDQRLVHVTLSLDDRARPGVRRYESKVLLMQSVEGRWRIRDLR